jgi:hypothetical protein
MLKPLDATRSQSRPAWHFQSGPAPRNATSSASSTTIAVMIIGSDTTNLASPHRLVPVAGALPDGAAHARLLTIEDRTPPRLASIFAEGGATAGPQLATARSRSALGRGAGQNRIPNVPADKTRP